MRVNRAVLISHDEYLSGEVPIEFNGSNVIIPIKDIRFIETDSERRTLLLNALNREISDHSNDWDWVLVETIAAPLGQIANEYITDRLWLSSSSGLQYEYIASDASVEARRIVHFRIMNRVHSITVGFTIIAWLLVLVCLRKLITSRRRGTVPQPLRPQV